MVKFIFFSIHIIPAVYQPAVDVAFQENDNTELFIICLYIRAGKILHMYSGSSIPLAEIRVHENNEGRSWIF